MVTISVPSSVLRSGNTASVGEVKTNHDGLKFKCAHGATKSRFSRSSSFLPPKRANFVTFLPEIWLFFFGIFFLNRSFLAHFIRSIALVVRCKPCNTTPADGRPVVWTSALWLFCRSEDRVGGNDFLLLRLLVWPEAPRRTRIWAGPVVRQSGQGEAPEEQEGAGHHEGGHVVPSDVSEPPLESRDKTSEFEH